MTSLARRRCFARLRALTAAIWAMRLRVGRRAFGAPLSGIGRARRTSRSGRISGVKEIPDSETAIAFGESEARAMLDEIRETAKDVGRAFAGVAAAEIINRLNAIAGDFEDALEGLKDDYRAAPAEGCKIYIVEEEVYAIRGALVEASSEEEAMRLYDRCCGGDIYEVRLQGRAMDDLMCEEYESGKERPLLINGCDPLPPGIKSVGGSVWINRECDAEEEE